MDAPDIFPIGMFDSGVGGLSVLRAVRAEIPSQPLIYLADQAHVPYGSRSLDEVRAFSVEITRFLLGQGARLIVVACNTASAAALHHLREVFPNTPFVGMEPAVKPAAEHSRTRKVGVLATPATFQGELFASLVERYAQDVEIYTNTCPGLVSEIEAGQPTGILARQILKSAVEPMLTQGVDTIVLGCTHYPFSISLIRELAGPHVEVIDPAPAVARQTRRLLQENGWLQTGFTSGPLRCLTSGDSRHCAALAAQLLGPTAAASLTTVEAVSWQAGQLEFQGL